MVSLLINTVAALVKSPASSPFAYANRAKYGTLVSLRSKVYECVLALAFRRSTSLISSSNPSQESSILLGIASQLMVLFSKLSKLGNALPSAASLRRLSLVCNTESIPHLWTPLISNPIKKHWQIIDTRVGRAVSGSSNRAKM